MSGHFSHIEDFNPVGPSPYCGLQPCRASQPVFWSSTLGPSATMWSSTCSVGSSIQVSSSFQASTQASQCSIRLQFFLESRQSDSVLVGEVGFILHPPPRNSNDSLKGIPMYPPRRTKFLRHLRAPAKSPSVHHQSP